MRHHQASSTEDLPSDSGLPEIFSCESCHAWPVCNLVLAWKNSWANHGVVDELRLLCESCAASEPGAFNWVPLDDAEHLWQCFEISDLKLSKRARRQLDETILALQDQESGKDASTEDSS